MKTERAVDADFAATLLAWFELHGRRDLPWQQPRSAYRVWLSEVMLQQTRVQTVIPFFERFVDRFPELPQLAAADESEVLALWSGLGYYSRARNLLRTACLCVERHGGELPRELAALAALPGIGRSTAAAILALAHDRPQAILDGNVRRVLARRHAIAGWPGTAAVQRELWRLAEAVLPSTRAADYTQALMDLGATVCTPRRPRCGQCPVTEGCAALARGLVASLPTARPPRRLPERALTLLLLRDACGRVLLERRPSNGVWARLWSLPEIPAGADLDAALRLDWGLDPDGGLQLSPFTHVFTHFRLRLSPLLYSVPDAATVRDRPEQRWQAPAEWRQNALPAPVRRLLEKSTAA